MQLAGALSSVWVKLTFAAFPSINSSGCLRHSCVYMAITPTVQFWGVLDRGVCSAVPGGFAGYGAGTEELKANSRVEKPLCGGAKISEV